MCVRKTGAVLLLVLLFLSGCAGSAPLSPPQANEEPLSLSAQFHTEGGVPLKEGAAQFSFGGSGDIYPLDNGGAVRVPGLPRDGEVKLTLFDPRQETQSVMTLFFSCGAVIDATTDMEGVGHITARSDTEEIALLFVLEKDGSLQCALWLTAQSE